MTIKELCEKYLNCRNCPFFKACPFCVINESLTLNTNNEECTKAIIETARILQEDDNEYT